MRPTTSPACGASAKRPPSPLCRGSAHWKNVYANLDDKSIKPKQREHLLECRADAELSHLLGTIRTDAPIDTAEGAYKVGEGNKSAAVRLMQELELHTLIPRFGLEGVAPEAAPEEVPTLEGHRLPAARTPRRALSGGHPPRRHGPPRGREKCRFAAGSVVRRAGQHRLPLNSGELVQLLDAPGVTLDVFDSAPPTRWPWPTAAGAAASSGTASWLPTCWTPRPPSIRSPSC